MPEPEPGPARKQPVQRAEGDLAQLSDRPPLHTAKADTPDRHDGPAQCCSGQRRLGSRSHRPAAVLGHGLKFRQHFVDKGIDVGKRIPRTWRGLCWTDGSSHSRASMLVLTVISSDCHRLGHHLQLDHKLQSASHQLAHASYKQILSLRSQPRTQETAIVQGFFRSLLKQRRGGEPKLKAKVALVVGAARDDRILAGRTVKEALQTQLGALLIRPGSSLQKACHNTLMDMHLSSARCQDKPWPDQ